MNARQANRAVIAKRAGARTSTGPVSTNLLARVTPIGEGGNVRNRRSPRMTATQRDSEGRYSDWNRSPFAPRGGWR